jgi:hypothetical protein
MTKAKKKTKDYFKLPFEVFFSNIAYTAFDLLYDPDDPPEWMEDYPAIRMREGRSYSALFACDSNRSGELKAVVYGGALEDYVPKWLSFVMDDDLDINSAQAHAFSIKDGELEFGKTVDDDELEEEEEVSFPSFFGGDGSVPKYLVLDSKGERLKVDMQGYPLDETGKRTGQPTVFDLSEEEAEDYCVEFLDWRTLRGKIGAFF